MLAGMTPPEPGAFDIALKFAPLIAAGGIWAIGIVMLFQNRSKTKEAAEDRKDAAADRKVTQGMLAALQELIRRTSPPPSQDGPQPGPAE